MRYTRKQEQRSRVDEAWGKDVQDLVADKEDQIGDDHRGIAADKGHLEALDGGRGGILALCLGRGRGWRQI